MEEKKNNEKDAAKIPRLKKPLEEFFTEDVKEDFNEIKNDATKRLYRVFAVLAIVAFGWIVFISLHCFLWSTDFTFYQNLVITFDSLIIALIFALGLVYKASGLGNVYNNTRALISKLTKKLSKDDDDQTGSL